MSSRPYTARETRWVAEYVQEKYPKAFDRGDYAFQVPLGPLSDGFTSRAAPRVDAVVFNDSRTVMIEGDIEKPMSALGDLIHYKTLFYSTRRMRDLVELPLVAILLLPDPDSNVIIEADKQGVLVDTYKPAWLAEYMVERRGRRGR